MRPKGGELMKCLVFVGSVKELRIYLQSWGKENSPTAATVKAIQ